MHGNRRIIKDVLDSLVVFVFAVALFIGAITLMSIFGGEIMRFFGLRYSSVQSLVLFFVIGSIISWPVSLVAEAIPKVLFFDKKLIRKWQAVVLYVVLATIATAIGLTIVDQHTTRVVANRTSIVVISLIFALFNCPSIIISRPENT